jgi:lipopolysaccharide export system ATP-binding protein
MSEASAAWLRAEGLTKSYVGRRVVNDVTISVQAGEVVGLLGPNGAGKTTSFYMIVGLTKPEAGRVTLNGEDVTKLPMYQRARRGIGYLPQEPSVFRKLSVEDNIRAILETLELSTSEREERLRQLLDELGTAKVAKSKAQSLSGGERRRLEITRALVISPSFMLLDEPFAGIDPIAVVDIQGIVSQLKKRGIGVLITDHNVRETLGICDRAYIVNEGTVLEEGTPEQIAASPRARQIYLGEKFRL